VTKRDSKSSQNRYGAAKFHHPNKVMPTQNRLNSVCYSIAHHANSGLSFIHPHIGKALKDMGRSSMTISLLDSDPCPVELKENKPLGVALASLKTKFDQILSSEGYSSVDLTQVDMTFSLDEGMDDPYCTFCRTKIISSAGKTFDHRVDFACRTC